MDMNITREALNINKVVCEKKEIINIQGDMIVPDSKPDILNTINTSGNICIYKKEIMDGKIRLDGNILTYIMYLADDNSGNIRGLSTGLDFSETINISELHSEMNVDVGTTIKSIECRVLNGRKIAIKVSIEISMKVHSQETVNIITDMNDENIQVSSQNMKINSVLGSGSTKAFVKENIMISNTDNLVEILNAQIGLVDKDIKISYNKVLAKSEVEIKLVYLTEDGRICTTQSRLPLVGFIDMPNIQENNICETTYMVRNIMIKPNSVEEHSVYFEIEVEISCMTYEEKEIKAIQDMYCPGEKMKFNQINVNTTANRQCKKNVCNIREKVNIPELENGSIVDVVIIPNITRESKLNGKILYEGELEVNMVFTDNSSVGINSKKVVIPFEQTIDGLDNLERCNIETAIEVNSQEFINQSGNVSANIDLGFEINSYRNAEIPIIDDIERDADNDLEDYSVVIYVVKSGDTLWQIAKRFGSTVDDIVRVNGIERPDRLNVGEKIYIPKYVLRRAREPISIESYA